MSSRYENLSKLITGRYQLALVLIAVSATLSFIILDRALETQSNRFDVVEIAAKQRMSSQRIGFLTNAIVHTADADLREHYRGELRRIVENMGRRHQILSLRTPSDPIPSGMRSILQDVYHEGLNPFAPKVDAFLGYARDVLNTADGKLDPDMPPLMRINIAGVDPILQTHALIVNLLRKDTIDAARRIQMVDALVWVLILVLLTVEVPLIFRPMARRATRLLEQTDAARRRAVVDAAAAKSAREGQASFIRTMSHELRTPLNAILGMAQLLRMDKLSPKQDEYANDIQQAGESLLDLINGILEFSRLEAGQVTIEKSDTHLEDELARTLSMFRPMAANKGLELSCQVDRRLAEHYWADGPRIRQILMNLIGNAVKFTDTGSVCVQASYAGPAGRASDLVRIEVRDTGIGISPESRERIFQEFQQADTSLARKYGGSGLGLAIARRLVHLMNGEIGVESTLGEGSIFWCTLALEWMTAAKSRPREYPDPEPDQRKVG